MKTFHHIIAAVDFTPRCRAALCEAAHLARQDEAAVTAVHVMGEPLMAAIKKALSTDEATVREEWLAKLRWFVDESGAENAASVKVELRAGHPFLELVQACETHNADLLVMGDRGSHDEPGRVGAITAKCVRKAPVDVLIVRKDQHGPFRHLAACVDFSENSAKAVQFALHLAERDAAALDCVHVYMSAVTMALDYGGFATPLPAIITDEEAAEAARAGLDDFLEPFTRKAPEGTVKHLVIEAPSVRDAIVDHVKNSGVDLVVLGTRGKSGLRELLIGTTAERILQHAPCSILAVKPDDFVSPIFPA